MLKEKYSIPSEYIKMVVTGEEKGLLLYGESSLGKSFQVKEILTTYGKKENEDYVIFSGHVTTLQFYCKLYECRKKIVIFDDIEILENKINLNMLKASLNEHSGNTVSYHTTNRLPYKVPPTFIFEGQIIILLNEKPDNLNLRAVENRILMYHLSFSRNEILNILDEIALNPIDKTTLKERKEVVQWIRENTTSATKNLNIRLYQHIIKFFIWNRKNWKILSLAYLNKDLQIQLVLDGYNERDFVLETGLSRATYYRIQKLIEDNLVPDTENA